MDKLADYRTLLHKFLSDYASIPYSYGDIRSYVIADREQNHFLLMDEGWNGQKRVHGCLVHAEIREDKIWIHYDGLEDSITEALVSAGVSKDCIVLAFHPPYVRQHTDYAVD